MLNIVIIEDYADFATLMQDFLRHALHGLHREHQCHVCPTIAAALSYLRDHPADLVILDLGLPDAMGLSGVRQVHSAYPEAPLLVVTGGPNGAQAQAVEAIGPRVHFLEKDGIEFATFSLKVRAILDAPRPAIPTGPVPLVPTTPPPAPPWAPPWWYPYARDGVAMLLLVTGLVLVSWSLDTVHQDHAQVQQQLQRHAEESEKARGRMERALGNLIDVLSKRSNY